MKKVKLAFNDFKEWFSVKRYLPDVGWINGFIASTGQPFGSGKTLSCISLIDKFVKRYDKRKVGKKIMHINVLSNIALNIECSNYIEIRSLQEIVDFLENKKNEEGIINYTYIFLDEVGTEFNSRSFSKNFTPEFLTKLVTVRHYNCAILYTAQNFFMVDKIFRDLTTKIYVCKHFWRYYKNLEYLPSDFEDYANINQVRPLKKIKFFAYPELFNLYDSSASFYTLKDKIDNNDYTCLKYEKDDVLYSSPMRLTKKAKKQYGKKR